MSSHFKTINPVDPSVKRPYRLEDLQALWDANSLAITAQGTRAPVKVIAGSFVDGVMTKPCIVAVSGKLYELPESSELKIGDSLYIGTVPSDDIRVFKNGSSHPFYLVNTLSNVGGEGFTRIFGRVTQELWDESMRQRYLPNSIPFSAIQGATPPPLSYYLYNSLTVGTDGIYDELLPSWGVNGRSVRVRVQRIRITPTLTGGIYSTGVGIHLTEFPSSQVIEYAGFCEVGSLAGARHILFSAELVQLPAKQRYHLSVPTLGMLEYIKANMPKVSPSTNDAQLGFYGVQEHETRTGLAGTWLYQYIQYAPINGSVGSTYIDTYIAAFYVV